MAKGKPIPETVQWIVIRLSTRMSVDEIAMYTDIGVRSAQRILAHFKKHGDVNAPKRAKPKPRGFLCDYDIQVCYYFIQICQILPFLSVFAQDPK